MLSVYKPVSHYLRGFHHQMVSASEGLEPVQREVTIRDLLNMTSGLVYPGSEGPAEKKMASLFVKEKHNLEKGKPVSTVDFANLGWLDRDIHDH